VTKGMGVAMAQWVVHRDPRCMTHRKNSAGALEDDLLKRLPRSLISRFGRGRASCIGNTFALMEAALILATIARKFRLRLVPNHPVVPLCVDHATAATWSARHAGVAGEKRSSVLVKRQASCRC